MYALAKSINITTKSKNIYIQHESGLADTQCLIAYFVPDPRSIFIRVNFTKFHNISQIELKFLTLLLLFSSSPLPRILGTGVTLFADEKRAAFFKGFICLCRAGLLPSWLRTSSGTLPSFTWKYFLLLLPRYFQTALFESV